MKNVLILIVCTFIFLCGCNLETNTSDPQSSTSIITSKADGLFLQLYHPTSDSVFVVSEAWAEKSWKYSIIKGKTQKETNGYSQINFKMNSIKDSSLHLDKFIIDWNMQLNDSTFVGQSNGIFELSNRNFPLPDTVEVTVNKINEKREVVKYARFKLVKAM